MESIILELQKDALDKNIKASELLRKALVVARKLKLSEFQNWIENELNGYESDVPDYRTSSGQIKGWNPYHGWVPVLFKDPEMGERLSKRPNGQTIAELEDLIDKSDSDSAFHMPFSQKIQSQLSKGFGFQTEVSLFVERSAIVRTLDAVRNIILNWALKLEEEGILGEGLSFSEKEKEVAAISPQNINNFFGPVSGSQIAQGSQRTIKFESKYQFDTEEIIRFINNLKEALDKIEIDEAQKGEIKSDIVTIDSQVNSPNPKPSIIKEGLQSIRGILEGASGSAVGQLIIEAGKLLMG